MFGGIYNWDQPRWGDCAGCGCNVNLNNHHCPELVRKYEAHDATAIRVPIDVVSDSVPVERIKVETPPTPRQLARAWTDFLAEVGAVETLPLGEWA